MKNLLKIVVAILVGGALFFSSDDAFAQTHAFPEAEGSAAYSVGGRGGMVYEVTNLNSSGSGSLWECLDALKQPSCTSNGTQGECARTCVFKVAGNIGVPIEWEIRKPYLTVAGQTAPGGGIQLSARNRSTGGLISIFTHDVIWRYTRLRIGYNPKRAGQSGPTFAVYQGQTNNIIFDHNSVSWGSDDLLLTWTNYDGVPKDITFSYNLVYEPLKAQSTPLSSGAKTRTYADQMTNIDWHHNLIANFSHRSPQSGNASTRFINNIEYNWAYSVINTLGGADFDIVGNVFKAGPVTPSSVHVVQTYRGHSTAASGDPSLYVVRNKSPNHSNPRTDNWNGMVYEISGYQQSEIGILPAKYKRSTPMPTRGVPITEDTVANIEKSLHTKVGAYRRLACDGSWVGNRDSSDARVVSDYLNGTGSLVVNDNIHCGGKSCWPVLSSGTPCSDSDHDGIPNIYETNKCGSTTCLNHSQIASNGYSNLENYLNGVVSKTAPPSTPSTPPTTPSTPPSVPSNMAPTISSFNANPTSIISGQSTTLSWVTSRATLSIKGIGTVTGNRVTVSPTTTRTYTLTATNSSGSVTKNVTVKVTPVSQSITSFALLDSNGQSVPDFDSITIGAMIDLGTVGSNLNIRANTSPINVGSVVFGYDGNLNYQTDNTAPYEFCSGTSCNFSLGNHTITATPYSLSNGGGMAGSPYTVNFTIVSSTSSVNPNNNSTTTIDTGTTVEIKTEGVINLSLLKRIYNHIHPFIQPFFVPQVMQLFL